MNFRILDYVYDNLANFENIENVWWKFSNTLYNIDFFVWMFYDFFYLEL